MRENRTTYAGTQPLNINNGPSFFNEFRITCIVELDPGPEAFMIRLCLLLPCAVIISLYYVVCCDECYVVYYMVQWNKSISQSTFIIHNLSHKKKV